MAQSYAVNLISLLRDFDTDEECRTRLEQIRWPDGIACPRCGGRTISRIQKRAQFDCDACRYQFSVTSGTIMHDTKIPLSKWFIAIYLILESKKGVSANQLSRTLGIGYKASWYLCHRIREALKMDNPRQLTGTVEVDETYVGGKVRGKGRGYRDNKAIVVGAIERGGEVRLQTVPAATRLELRGFVNKNVATNVPEIFTDENAAYGDMTDADTRHETVKHRAEEWVRGDVHTNTIEGSWAFFKRGVVGSYHQVSKKHLDRYLHEFEFRQNNRNNPHIFRDALRELLTSGNIEYKELIA